MKLRSLLAIGIAASLLSGCGQGEEKKATMPVSLGEYAIQSPIHEGNISIYPVTLASIQREVIVPAEPVNDVATLEEALKNDWIVIRESDAENFQIDGVSVTNKGPKRVLLMAGELLIGGHQDRVVGADTIIEPGQTVTVPVYCVEEGRSTGETDVFQPADHSVPTSVKIAALGGDQSAVWSNVSAFNLGVGMKSHGVTTVNAGLKTEKVQVRQKKEFDNVWSKLSSDSRTVGAIISVDGKILSLELFGTNRVFTKGMPSILRGAIAEGAASTTDRRGVNDLGAVVKQFAELKYEADREMRRARSRGSVRGAQGVTAASIPGKNGKHLLVHSTYVFTGH